MEKGSHFAVSHQDHPLAQVQRDDRRLRKSNRGHRTSPAAACRRRYAPRMHPAIDQLESRTLLTTSLDQIHLPVGMGHQIVTIETGELSGHDLAQDLAGGKGEHHDYILATTKEIKLARHTDRQERLEEAQVRHAHSRATASLHFAAAMPRVKTKVTVTTRAGVASRRPIQSQAHAQPASNQITIASASTVATAASAPAPTSALQETLNVQLQPGDGGALSELIPLITTAGATVQKP